MDDLNLVFESAKSGDVSVGSSGVDVVSEGENSIDGFCRPIGKEVVQEALIATVEASFVLGEFDQLVECVHGWFVNEDAGVEATRPATIGDCGDFFALKQIVDVFDDERVCVEEDHFAVLS